MDGYQHFGAGSQYVFDTPMGTDYEPLDNSYAGWQYPEHAVHQSRNFEQDSQGVQQHIQVYM